MIYHLDEIDPTELEKIGRLSIPHRRGTAAPNAQVVKAYNDSMKVQAEQKLQEYIKNKKKQIEESKKVTESLLRAQDSLNQTAPTAKNISESINTGTDIQNEEVKESRRPYVYAGRSLWELAKLFPTFYSAKGNMMQLMGKDLSAKQLTNLNNADVAGSVLDALTGSINIGKENFNAGLIDYGQSGTGYGLSNYAEKNLDNARKHIKLNNDYTKYLLKGKAAALGALLLNGYQFKETYNNWVR